MFEFEKNTITFIVLSWIFWKQFLLEFRKQVFIKAER